MELYILSKQDLSILSICKLADYQINLDEETNAKSTFTLMKTNGLKKENYMVLNGLYRQFIFVIDDVQTEKESDVVTVTALDISNIFDRKVIEKNIDIMKSKSIEEFLANTISENFVNSDDTALNVNYIEIYWHTNTQGNIATNAENGLYNFHTFLTNCRQYKNIYTDFKLENLGNTQTVEGKRINVEAKNRKIVDISLHGESTQSGTPTTGNLVEIENVEGKNIWNKSEISEKTSTVNMNVGELNVKDVPIPFTFSSYLISNALTDTNVRVSFIDSNNSNIGAVKFGNTVTSTNKRSSITINEIPEGTVKIRFGIRLQDGGHTEKTQLEAGTVATPYVPYNSLELKVTNGLEETDENYQEQVATFPLGEGEKLMEGSYLADDGIHHKRKQYTFTGNETFVKSMENNNYIRFYSPVFADVIKTSGYETIDKFICTHFEHVSDYNSSKNCIALNGKRFYITISKAIVTDVTTFKTLLSEQYANGTPVIVEYELSEEETVPYTAEQQEAWNKIKNLTLFEGLNHISSNANMVLKYYPLEPVGLKFVLRIDIENKQETTELIDTTLPEVTDYNKIYEADVTAKVQVYIREDGSEYNLYLKTDRTTTTNKDDPDRASGKIEVISVETADRAEEEALNVMKGNNYKHLVEFKIAKTSKLMDITKLHIR